MIAIAIIGILALVLIPKVGGMKSQAKLAGMDTNLRLAQSTIEGLITDLQPGADEDATATVLTGFESTLATRLGTGSTDKLISNPITKAQGVKALSAADATGTITGGAAFAYATGGENTTDVPTDPSEKTALKGVIVYNAYYDGSVIKVRLVPYDDNGAPMTNKVKTVEQ